jgi:hypothetical protein
VGRDLLGAEAVDDVREDVAGLVGVAGEHVLGALTCARADGLDLLGTEVLGLVDDPVLRRDRTTSDVGERFDLNDAEVDELFVAAAALLLLRRPSHPDIRRCRRSAASTDSASPRPHPAGGQGLCPSGRSGAERAQVPNAAVLAGDAVWRKEVVPRVFT